MSLDFPVTLVVLKALSALHPSRQDTKNTITNHHRKPWQWNLMLGRDAYTFEKKSEKLSDLLRTSEL